MLRVYLNRLLVSLKRNGFQTTILNFPSKFRVVFRDFWPNKRNKYIKNLIKEYTSPLPISTSFIGGYTIDLSGVYRDSGDKNAFCFGIYDDVTTELALNDVGFHVYAFDPTPITQTLFEDNRDFNKFIDYFPWAVWKEDAELKFFFKSNDDGLDNFEGTLGGIEHGDRFELVQAFSLKTLIKKFNLNQLDYLKMDIEGAVPEVLLTFFEDESNQSKYPTQIAFELEVPEHIETAASKKVCNRIEELFIVLGRYYDVYNVPDDSFYLPNIHLHAQRKDI